MAIQGMNERINMRTWRQEERYILVTQSQKGYSGVFYNHNKLCRKRVIVHKALEQKLPVEGYIILSCNIIFERDNFYLLSDADIIEPEIQDVTMAISAAREIASREVAYEWFLYNFYKVRNVYAMAIFKRGEIISEYYLIWRAGDETVQYHRNDKICKYILPTEMLTHDTSY